MMREARPVPVGSGLLWSVLCALACQVIGRGPTQSFHLAPDVLDKLSWFRVAGSLIFDSAPQSDRCTGGVAKGRGAAGKLSSDCYHKGHRGWMGL